MLNISGSCQYALKALIYLSRNSNNNYIKITEIARKEKLPYNYLGKIFGQLIKDGVVESSVGPLGGVRLASNGYRASLATIIATVDGRPSFDKCTLFGDRKCSEEEDCPIHLECRKLGRMAWQKLKQTRLGDFRNGK